MGIKESYPEIKGQLGKVNSKEEKAFFDRTHQLLRYHYNINIYSDYNLHLGLLKEKIANLGRDQVESIMSSGGTKGESFNVIKSGDDWAGLIGFP